MDYETDKKMEAAMIGSPLGDQPGSKAKKPPPSCMREHIDHLQAEVNELSERSEAQCERIQRLEKLVSNHGG